MKYIRDPVYGDIEIPDEFVSIIDHPKFQRLRRLHQLSLAYLVYPSAVHTRFEHSIGVFHVTRHATDDEAAWVYALLHDVGHGPFSHLLELALLEFGKPFDHEVYGKKVAKEILEDSVFSAKEVFSTKDAVLVHGGVGTDRIDYLQRDSLFTGIGIGRVEWDRLVRNMWVEKGDLYISRHVLPNAEHLYVARFILGDAVYFHKTVLIADRMFIRAVLEVLEYYSPKELISMDEYDLVAAFRKTGSVWWRRIEERKLFKIVFRGGERKAKEVHDKYAKRYGEDAVLLGYRPKFYSRPDVYLDDGEPILQASPLLQALRKSEERRSFWFVAVDPLKIPLP